MIPWIKVKDQLPEDGQKVWYYFNANIYVGWFTQKGFKGQKMNTFYGESGWLSDVTHWMPYKAGDKIPETPEDI